MHIIFTYNVLSGSNGYKSGFNGMEKENELYGEGNTYDFGARLYDGRLGKFMSVDPLSKQIPTQSPYIFAGDNPILYIDINGEFKFPAATQYPFVAAFLNNNLIDILNDQKIMDALYKYSNGNLDYATVKSHITGTQHTIEVKNVSMKLADGFEITGLGSYPWQNNFATNRHFVLDASTLNEIERILRESSSEFEKEAAKLLLLTMILHEYTHLGAKTNNGSYSEELSDGTVIWPEEV